MGCCLHYIWNIQETHRHLVGKSLHSSHQTFASPIPAVTILIGRCSTSCLVPLFPMLTPWLQNSDAICLYMPKRIQHLTQFKGMYRVQLGKSFERLHANLFNLHFLLNVMDCQH